MYTIHAFKADPHNERHGVSQRQFISACAASVAAASRFALESSPNVPFELRNAYKRITLKRSKPGKLGRRKLSLTGDDELDGILFAPMSPLGKRPRQASIALSLQELEEKEKV
jgi:hypothetical protein